MNLHHRHLAPALILATAVLAGCGDQGAVDRPTAKREGPTKSSANGEKHSHAEDCDHVEKGPHGGQVFELGGAYHAELVHDYNAHLISVYLLDAQAREPVAIEEREIVVNALVKGKPVTFELAAAPLAGDGDGRSSRFQSKDDVL